MSKASLQLLLVEDEESIAKPLMKLLQMRGLEINWVRDGQEALDWLSENEAPSCMLVDIMMPRLNGWELRERQLQTSAISKIPVVFFSADNQSAREAEARREYFVSKPIDLDVLHSTIERAISQGSA